MTRLFNLESYIECCQYTRLFASSEQFDGNNPRAYKAFLQKYAPNSYLPEPIPNSNRPSCLEVNPDSLPTRSIGTELPGGDKQRLVIIRDTMDLMTLSMSNILEYQDGYLYSSAYHYWNHYHEISNHNLNVPLVFVDLDSFGIERLIPINPSTTEGSAYQVPILDTRKSIDINFEYNPRSIYDNICSKLAQRILNDHFPTLAENSDTINHLAKYLQKICFFQVIQPYTQENYIELIIEILHQNQIYYKQVTIDLSQIQDMVIRQINPQIFNNLARDHREYKFVFISHYNFFPNIQRELTEFLCLNPATQEFSKIWQYRNQNEFPLFGIYLDALKFGVAISNELQWIEISNQEDNISYEGRATELIGRNPRNAQGYFWIRQGTTTARLPIQVNGEDYRINDIPQDYSIEIQNYQGKEDLEIRIEFKLKPGSLPELRVTDREGKYRIDTALKERQKYTYIPPEKINKTRQQKSLEQITRLLNRNNELEQFESYLSQIRREVFKIEINYRNVNNLVKNSRRILHSTKGNIDLLQSVDTSDKNPVVTRWANAFQQNRLHQLVQKIVIQFVNRERTPDGEQLTLLKQTIMFIGKTYKFATYLSIENLFDRRLVNQIITTRVDIAQEYFQCLARVATSEELQKQYFSWFSDYYKHEKYMWGYGRILLWYYNFNTTNSLLNYQNHYYVILEHLDSHRSNLNVDYKKNAFLALLYLLTFRDRDINFCAPGSNEKRQAGKVIEQYSNETIFLNQVSRTKPLNHFFEEMIAGKSTAPDVEDLLSAD